MNLHNADIASRLRRFLDRRQPPRRVEGKPQAEADEVKALVATAERNAPRDPDRLAAWWPAFERELGEAGSGLWPTEKEVREAAGRANASQPKAPSQALVMDTYAIMAKRMAAGDPVGEGYLYGREAVEMIRRRLVDEPTMRAYRSGAFLARRKTQGEASALAWEAESKARHEAAKLMLRDTETRNFRAEMPDKSFGVTE